MHAPARNRHDTYAADEAAVRGLHDMVDTLRADRTELVRHYRARQRRLRKAMEAPPPQTQRWTAHSPSPPPPPSPQPASMLASEIPVPVPEIEPEPLPEPEPEPESNRDEPEHTPPSPLEAAAPSPLAAVPAVAAEAPAVVSSAAAAEVAPRPPPSPSPLRSSHSASSPPLPLSAAASPVSPPHHDAADIRSVSDECPSSGPVLAHEPCAAVLKRNVISAEYTAEPMAAECAAALAEVVVTPQHAAAGRQPAAQQAEETRPRTGAVVAELPPPCLAPSTALSAASFTAPCPPRLQNSIRDPTVVATLARVAPQTPEPPPPLPLQAAEPVFMEEAPPVAASVAVVASATALAEEEIVKEAAPACGECLLGGSAVNYCGSCELDVCAQCSRTHPLPYHDLAPLSDWEAAQGADEEEEEEEEDEEEEEEDEDEDEEEDTLR